MSTSPFFRLETDGTKAAGIPQDAFAGPGRTACWIIGGGPSLTEMPCAEIAASPAPNFGVNLAGTGTLRTNLWTSYDPSARFHRSVYLDASIVKFVHRRRAMDLVPETTFTALGPAWYCCYLRRQPMWASVLSVMWLAALIRSLMLPISEL